MDEINDFNCLDSFYNVLVVQVMEGVRPIATGTQHETDGGLKSMNLKLGMAQKHIRYR